MRTFMWFVLAMTAVLVGAAFYFGWFTLTTERHDGMLTTSFTIRTDLVKEAEDTVKEKVGKIDENVNEHVAEPKGSKTVHGTVSQIEAYTHLLMVKTADEQTLTFQLEPSSTITKAGLQGLQVGDPVTVVYHVKEGKNLVRSITVEHSLPAS